MKNPGYYLWKDDEKIEKIERENEDMSSFSALEIRPHESSLKSETGELILLAQNLRILEKQERVSAVFLLLTFIDVICIGGAFFSSFSLFFAIPSVIAGIATIYYFFQDRKSPLSLNELENMRRQILFSANSTKEDAELVEKHIAKTKLMIMKLARTKS